MGNLGTMSWSHRHKNSHISIEVASAVRKTLLRTPATLRICNVAKLNIENAMGNGKNVNTAQKLEYIFECFRRLSFQMYAR
jgi:hypothetical protein